MKRIGIMGGTFNPIHNAHLMMAQAAYEQYKLDEVWFMPSGTPPHKARDEIVSDEHRRRMVQFAIDSVPYFTFSDMELRREGTTYTSDTMEILHGDYPKARFYFILGGDSLEDFDKWHEPEKILRYGKILAAPRGKLSDKEVRRLCKEMGRRFHGEILPLRMNHVRISSEQIRGRIGEGKSALAFCPESVNTYIQLHGLYGSPKKTWKKAGVDKDLLGCLAATLRPKRYIHTLGVAHTAAALAFCHGTQPDEDVGRAQLAGMLHDCAKYYTGSEMISLCDRHGIPLSGTERKNTALIHGKLGAFLAKERYGVTDDEICSAISYHTTGKPDMTLLEKIIYVADYIEPSRQMDGKPYPLADIRRECFRDLDGGMLMILTNTVEYLENSEMEIDEMSLRTYEYYSGER